MVVDSAATLIWKISSASLVTFSEKIFSEAFLAEEVAVAAEVVSVHAAQGEVIFASKSNLPTKRSLKALPNRSRLKSMLAVQPAADLVQKIKTLFSLAEPVEVAV